jgi:hypothetical protein
MSSRAACGGHEAGRDIRGLGMVRCCCPGHRPDHVQVRHEDVSRCSTAAGLPRMHSARSGTHAWQPPSLPVGQGGYIRRVRTCDPNGTYVYLVTPWSVLGWSPSPDSSRDSSRSPSSSESTSSRSSSSATSKGFNALKRKVRTIGISASIMLISLKFVTTERGQMMTAPGAGPGC